jgi:hypothetical protein
MNAWRDVEAKAAEAVRRPTHWWLSLWLMAALSLGCGSVTKTATNTGTQTGSPTAAPANGGAATDQLIAMVPFGERNGDEDYNASGVVPLADGRFLFCDNNVGDAFYELTLSPQGQKQGPVLRRALQGLPPGLVDDLEGLTQVTEQGRRYIFALSSLYLKKAKKNKPDKLPPSGLLRVSVGPNDSLQAENMPGFSAWFLQQVPELASAATLEPDDGGLNIEGLAWDAKRRALLLGVRTPAPGGQPLIVPLKVKDLAGPWTTGNLERLPTIRLALPTTAGELGIRSLEYSDEYNAFLVLAGKTISDSTAPFALFEWDGQTSGGVKRLPFSFAHKVKPEGVTTGTVGGKPVLLFVDDGGGFHIQPIAGQ